jgi:hypothetical protein
MRPFRLEFRATTAHADIGKLDFTVYESYTPESLEHERNASVGDGALSNQKNDWKSELK